MPSQHSEVKAGAFVAFCIALLFVMAFAVGDCGRIFRGTQEQVVLFSHVTGLQPNSAVNYAGVEIGRVREVRIATVDGELLATMPRLSRADLDRLPLTFEEAERLKAAAGTAGLDAEARRLITGRKMIALHLEIKRSRQELSFRENDLIRLETTLMGDSTVEISPGSGAPVPRDRALLGDGSNLFTQLSASMREIRKLLGKVSGIIGEEERVAIKTTLANVKKASESMALASEDVRKAVEEARKPVKEAISDFRAGMGEARTTVAEVHKTVTEVKPKVVSALESGKKMMESGRKAAESADRLLTEARPKVVKLLEEAAGTARTATSVLKETEALLAETGDALDENRPAVRRALADLRESARSFKEMSARLKRQPWLLLKKPRGRQDVVLLESSARSLAAASGDLAVTMEYLKKIADDPQAAARLQAVKVQDLLKEIRRIHGELDSRRRGLDKKVKELDRKGGGRLLRRAREKADQEK